MPHRAPCTGTLQLAGSIGSFRGSIEACRASSQLPKHESDSSASSGHTCAFQHAGARKTLLLLCSVQNETDPRAALGLTARLAALPWEGEGKGLRPCGSRGCPAKFFFRTEPAVKSGEEVWLPAGEPMSLKMCRSHSAAVHCLTSDLTPACPFLMGGASAGTGGAAGGGLELAAWSCQTGLPPNAPGGFVLVAPMHSIRAVTWAGLQGRAGQGRDCTRPVAHSQTPHPQSPHPPQTKRAWPCTVPHKMHECPRIRGICHQISLVLPGPPCIKTCSPIVSPGPDPMQGMHFPAIRAGSLCLPAMLQPIRFHPMLLSQQRIPCRHPNEAGACRTPAWQAEAGGPKAGLLEFFPRPAQKRPRALSMLPERLPGTVGLRAQNSTVPSPFAYTAI